MTDPRVTVKDLKIGATTDSGRDVEIIRGVSFDIAPGEIIALIGESGSGKTTIALSLMGHTRTGCEIRGGSITLGQDDITAMSERQRAGLRGTKVSYVPQSAAAASLDRSSGIATIVRCRPPTTIAHGNSEPADNRPRE